MLAAGADSDAGHHPAGPPTAIGSDRCGQATSGTDIRPVWGNRGQWW